MSSRSSISPCVAGGLDRVLVHRHVLGAGDDEVVDPAERRPPRRSAARSAAARPRPRLVHPDAPAAGAAAERVVAVARHLDELAAESLEDAARRVVDAVVAPERAGVVVGDAVGEPAAPARARPDSSSSSRSCEWWSTVQLPPKAGYSLRSVLKRVRVAGDDALELAAPRSTSMFSLGERSRRAPPRRRGARRCPRCARRRRGSRSRRRRAWRIRASARVTRWCAGRTRRSRRRTRARRPAPCGRP